MCGIVGYCDFNKKSTETELTMMMQAIEHRGSDANGHSFHNYSTAIVGLGHQRLSVIDLSEGGIQPMSFEHLEIVYNGEVYNFKEVRTELEKLDYNFNSQSDTEVILKAYHCWGIEALQKFNGMFSMVILDKEKERLTLIRDRAGVKPLYWYQKDGLFLFASELKSFHQHSGFEKKINKDVLAQYLQHGYVLQPNSIFEHTEQLNAGHLLELDIKTQKIEKKEYWSVSTWYEKPKLILTDNEAIDETEKILKKSFEYRMVSDVPVGTFLSGGYDSSLVTALLQADKNEKINTFTIGFEEKGYDESPYAKRVSEHLGTNHTEYYCTHKDALEIIPKLAEIYDEPFGDASAIPTVLVSQLAREHVTVSLSADGGDEIFAGYSAYDNLLKIDEKFSKVPSIVKQGTAGILNMVNPSFIPFMDSKYNFEIRYEKIKKMLTAQSAAELLEQSYEQYSTAELNRLLLHEPKKLYSNFDADVSKIEDQLSEMLMIDYKTYMADDILTKVDRATMSVGLEGREPFLDSSIIEFAAQLPNEMKYRDGEKKWILKQVTHKYLPESMMNRPKMGFSPPITEWFRDELKSYFLYYLSHERLNEEGLFNPDEVVRMRDEYLGGKNVSVHRLWFILMFEMWYERWM
jgi:asparagine synthase (glutamine-hydrolysing)